MKKTFSIAISLVLLVSTLGFGITNHYCGGQLKDTGIIVENCCGDSNCCENKTEFHQLDEDYQVSSANLKLIPDFVFTWVVGYFTTLFEKEQSFQFSTDKSPPGPDRAIYMLIQSFLL